MNALLAELKRRKVLRVASVYVLTSWMILQVAEVLVPALQLDDWALSLVLLMLVLGFPVALVCSWALDLGPDGLRLETDATHSMSSPALGALSLTLVAAAGLAGYHLSADAVPEPVAQEPGIAIAVLPFANMSTEQRNRPFADGMTEELLNSLVALNGPNVVARTSAYAYQDRGIDLRQVGRALGASHLIEGSVRQSGERLRITAQLIDAASGYHLGSYSFESALDAPFESQIEISRAIAAAVADALTEREHRRITTI